jgi:uncharacterized protein YbjQ (UPF0145 family)
MPTPSIKITTTPGFDGIVITQYLQPVFAHTVIGMNIFKDFVAGITDIIGGHSKSYEKTLQNINEDVLQKLSEKALKLGANCIVGLRIENDQISSGGKSMLMVSATGTAAIAGFSEIEETIEHSVEELQPQVVNEIEQAALSKEELDKATRLGITMKDGLFCYGVYKYSKLDDAIDYAELQSKKSKQQFI